MYVFSSDLGFSPSRKHLAKAHVLDLDDNNCSDLTDLDLSADLDGNSSSIDDDLSDDSDILMPKKTYDIKSHLNTSQRSWKKQTKLQTPASVRVSSPVTGIPSGKFFSCRKKKKTDIFVLHLLQSWFLKLQRIKCMTDNSSRPSSFW